MGGLGGGSATFVLKPYSSQQPFFWQREAGISLWVIKVSRSPRPWSKHTRVPPSPCLVSVLLFVLGHEVQHFHFRNLTYFSGAMAFFISSDLRTSHIPKPTRRNRVPRGVFVDRGENCTIRIFWHFRISRIIAFSSFPLYVLHNLRVFFCLFREKLTASIFSALNPGGPHFLAISHVIAFPRISCNFAHSFPISSMHWPRNHTPSIF